MYFKNFDMYPWSTNKSKIKILSDLRYNYSKACGYILNVDAMLWDNPSTRPKLGVRLRHEWMKQLHFDSILHIHVMWQVIVIIGEGEGHTVSSLSLGEWWWMNELRREIMKVVESTAMFLSVFGQTKHQQWEFPSWASPFQVLIVTIIIWYFFKFVNIADYHDKIIAIL
jgi:hypothetical protein